MTFPQIIWDLETYPNCFLMGLADLNSDWSAMYELSDQRNDWAELWNFLQSIIAHNGEMIGFNSLGFDYPVLHHLLSAPDRASAKTAYDMAQRVINARDGGGNRWTNIVWADQRYVRQIDLWCTNHFDNFAKQTSLKALQFAMRAESIEDLPIPPGTVLTPEQIQIVRDYCGHDVSETKRFAEFNRPEIEFRRSLVAHFNNIEVLNWADTKIGSEFVIHALGPAACYIKERGKRRVPRQTLRGQIVVADILFPYLEFARPEAQHVFQTFKASKIDAAKPGALSQSCTIDGFQFDFGVGGVHGSAAKRIFRSTDTHIIIDADVTSLYPSIAIENGMYPEHLGEEFVHVYRGLRDERVRHAKGTPINAALKLALNGTYGNTNNAYSPMFDAQYTMQTTINGQLLLLMLAERLLAIPGLELIQINTDGVTMYAPRDQQGAVLDVCTGWQALTKLTLEYDTYSMFACRDVNNYLALSTSGKIKRKGAYDYPPEWKDYSGWWNKDYSALVVPRAAEASLLHGTDVAEFILAHRDPFDFMLRAKTPAGSRLYYEQEGAEPVEQQRIVRYHAARGSAGVLVKQSPPVEGASPGHYKRKNGITDEEWAAVRALPTEEFDGGTRPVHDERYHTKNKSTYDQRRMVIHSNCYLANDIRRFDWHELDVEWYVSEARKLVDVFA